ncbi:DNA recombination protein RmuC [Woodsholea maritima]|uniref:DNA recombination protein RmuC n=1 Tax=Woodsholea maritima TaxID=240237 RepID=UPI000381711B|nr:DNA recombination protein RmuC [Woodsholea maritima]
MDGLNVAYLLMGAAMLASFAILLAYGFLREGQMKSLNARLEDVQRQLRETEILKAQSEQAHAVAEAKALRVEGLEARLEEEAERRQRAETRAADLEARASRIETLENRVQLELDERRKVETELARLKSESEERQKGFTEKSEALTQLRGEIEERLKVMAHDVLGESQKRFFEQAQESFKVQAEHNQVGVKSLVEPIRERLDAFKTKIEGIEKERAEHRGQMESQIGKLSEGLARQHQETTKLVHALQRSSTTRGQWGERTVENILELAGLTKGIDYEGQHQTRTGEGDALRPDFVVRLPGGGRFVIDSKVALSAYLDAVEARDDTARKDALRRHAHQVRTHMKQLAKKDYAKHVDGAIDFVALFIPGESFYSAAVDEDPGLFDDAIAAGVIIVTPATLLALSKAVSYGWNQQALEANAKQISALGAEIYDRLSTFSDHLGRVGTGLKTATSNYNKAVASLEGRVLVSARKMSDLNATSGVKAIEAPVQVEDAPRQVSVTASQDTEG